MRNAHVFTFVHCILATLAVAIAGGAHAQIPPLGAEVEFGFDRWGGDYDHTIVTSPEACHAACVADRYACKAYAFMEIETNRGHCWKKSTVPPPTLNPCCTSGAMPMLLDNDADRWGSDYRSFEADAPETCEHSCREETRCKASTWVRPGRQGARGVCYLKNALPPLTANNCCTSAERGPSLDLEVAYFNAMGVNSRVEVGPPEIHVPWRIRFTRVVDAFVASGRPPDIFAINEFELNEAIGFDLLPLHESTFFLLSQMRNRLQRDYRVAYVISGPLTKRTEGGWLGLFGRWSSEGSLIIYNADKLINRTTRIQLGSVLAPLDYSNTTQHVMRRSLPACMRLSSPVTTLEVLNNPRAVWSSLFGLIDGPVTTQDCPNATGTAPAIAWRNPNLPGSAAGHRIGEVAFFAFRHFPDQLFAVFNLHPNFDQSGDASMNHTLIAQTFVPRIGIGHGQPVLYPALLIGDLNGPPEDIEVFAPDRLEFAFATSGQGDVIGALKVKKSADRNAVYDFDVIAGMNIPAPPPCRRPGRQADSVGDHCAIVIMVRWKRPPSFTASR